MRNYEIRTVKYNWTPEGIFSTASKGKNNVRSIFYHEPQSDGDRHYCDIVFEDGSELRVFNINTIYK